MIGRTPGPPLELSPCCPRPVVACPLIEGFSLLFALVGAEAKRPDTAFNFCWLGRKALRATIYFLSSSSSSARSEKVSGLFSS